jgi:hypothetical protein
MSESKLLIEAWRASLNFGFVRPAITASLRHQDVNAAFQSLLLKGLLVNSTISTLKTMTL